jgi:hypothetical protein
VDKRERRESPVVSRECDLILSVNL